MIIIIIILTFYDILIAYVHQGITKKPGFVRWTIPQEDAEAVGSMGSMAEGAGPTQKRCGFSWVFQLWHKSWWLEKKLEKYGKVRIDVDLFKWFKHTWDADKDFVQLNQQADNVFPEHLTCHEVLAKAKR